MADLRRLQSVLGEWDEEVIGRLLDDDVVLHVPGRSLLGGTHRGREAVLRLLAAAREHCLRNPCTTTPTAFSITDGRVTARAVHRAIVNGNALTYTRTDLYFLEHGRVKDWWVFARPSEAFDAYWSPTGSTATNMNGHNHSATSPVSTQPPPPALDALT